MSQEQWLLADDTRRVRPVERGDGFVCALAHRQRVTPCGPPVAVAEVRKKRSDIRKKDDIVYWTSKTLCSRHLVDALVPDLRVSQTPRYQASEALIQAHREEFELLCEHYAQLQLAEQLKHLPPEVLALIQPPEVTA